jgi:quinoprotein glucose dehydrogenase
MAQLKALALVLAWAAAPIALAWADASVWDGIYTRAQADRGRALYAKECASCHKEDLGGHGTTPSLAGAEFMEKWDGEALDDLFEKMQTAMPADHPGHLSREQNAAILAYILLRNDFPVGGADLRSDPDWLAKVRFTAAKPK